MTLYPFPSSLRTFWKNQGLVPAYETDLNIHKDYLVDTLSQKFI